MTNPFQRLPPPAPPQPTLLSSLDDLNLKQELLEAYNKAKTLLAQAEYDESIPLNQKVQAVNSIAAILQTIAKTQESLHNTQTITKIEAVLINVLKTYPELREAFLEDYERALNA